MEGSGDVRLLPPATECPCSQPYGGLRQSPLCLPPASTESKPKGLLGEAEEEKLSLSFLTLPLLLLVISFPSLSGSKLLAKESNLILLKPLELTLGLQEIEGQRNRLKDTTGLYTNQQTPECGKPYRTID